MFCTFALLNAKFNFSMFVFRETNWGHETDSQGRREESGWQISRRANLPRYNVKN